MKRWEGKIAQGVTKRFKGRQDKDSSQMSPKEIEWLWQPLKNLKCYHHSIRLVYKLIWAKHNILPGKSSYCSYSRHRTVQLERLAALFPQPITFESRRRNLQRFLKLPQLRVKLLWFPLIKHIIKQEFSRKNKNRHQRRKLKKLRHLGHLLLVIDRTDWKRRNLFVASVICGKRALPVYWILLDKKGSSNLGEQKKFRSPCVKTLKILSSRRDRCSRISECSTRKVFH